MSEEQKHTPTPYSTEHDGVGTSHFRLYGTENGKKVLIGSIGGLVSDRTNRDFIVRACNSHDALVDLLRNSTGQLNRLIKIIEADEPFISNNVRGFIKIFEQALADATKEPESRG